MRGILFLSSVLVSGLCAVGCAQNLPEHVALEPAAENVEIAAEPPSANDYKLVGTVTGSAASNDAQAAEHAAKNDLRNKAAALGASLVTVDQDTGEMIPLQDKTKVKIVGRAYKAVEE